MSSNIRSLRKDIQSFLKVNIVNSNISYDLFKEEDYGDYTQKLIIYPGSEDDQIKAYLLIPKGKGPFPGVLVHHQHNGERHLGKSEVCGLVGDRYQAFGPELVKKGIAVLARSEEHTSELQSRPHLVCRLLL